jgi:transposase
VNMYKIEADHNQAFLMPPRLDDWVGEDDPVRFINDFVNSLNLKEKGIVTIDVNRGRPGYSDSLLLKIWLYGYFEGIKSSRKLEKASHQQLPLIWLTGMNYPDHNTLWLFLTKNRESIKELFKEAVKVCSKCGLVGLVLQAVDGTKLRADVSSKKQRSRKELELILEVLDEQIGEYISEVDKNEKEEKWNYKLPVELKDRKSRKERIEKIVVKMSQEKRVAIKNGVEKDIEKFKKLDRNYINLTDEDSRLIKSSGKYEFSYNAQAVVDESSGIIVAADVIQEESDNYALVNMLDKVKENLGSVSEETAGDCGYFSGDQLLEAEKKGYNVLVNIPDNNLNYKHDRDSKFNQSNFSYDKDNDCYICFNGGRLARHDTRRDEKYEIKRYECKNYKTCALRYECSSSKEGRKIYITPYYYSIENQLNKQKDEAKKALLKKRKQIIEPIFGYIKENLGFRRLAVRGIEKVKAQWYLICTTVNLKKLYKIWAQGKVQFA